MSTVKVSEEGKIAIPNNILNKYKINPDSIIELIALEDRLVLYPESTDPIKKAKGFLHFKESAKMIMEKVRKEENEVTEGKPWNQKK